MSDEDAPTARGRGLGRPARLSRQQIVDAALDGHDLETLTMRELARSLGVTHGALYRWVKNQDEVFDLVADVLIDRILPSGPASPRQLQPWLRQVAQAMHDEFLAVPGFATRLSRPHRHSTRAFGRLRATIISAFQQTGASTELAEQSWYVFIVSTVSWLAAEETPLDLGADPLRFDLFLDTLLRGLPARER